MFSSDYYSSFHTVERIIKHFFARFKIERALFQQHFMHQNPPLTLSEQEQLLSLFMNRLILLYFLQKRGLLDGDIHYLTHHLHITQSRTGLDTFYHSFLLILFHQGLGTAERSPGIIELLGETPLSWRKFV